MVKKLTNIAVALIKETFLGLSESLIGQENFAMGFLKTLISLNEKDHHIEKLLSKFMREPFKTALGQFKTGYLLDGTSKDERSHRETRFRDSLTNFDKALSLAKSEEEEAFINLMRGLCAINIPGGVGEAKIHFKTFQKYCIKKASELKCEVDSLVNNAKENEEKAGEINVDDLPGRGGGSLAVMDDVVLKINKAYLLTEAKGYRNKAAHLMEESSVLLNASEVIKTIIDNA